MTNKFQPGEEMFDDVAGHEAAPIIAKDEDTEGHLLRKPDDEETEGHKAMAVVDDDDDDTEGHRAVY